MTLSMYIPEHFAFEEHHDVIQFARQNNFATLVSMDASMPYATHVPLIVRDIEGGIILEGHMAKANPHLQLLEQGHHLVIFHGPHAYISPTWYSDPGVPTWNYVAVHMTGSIDIVTAPDVLRTIINRLAAIHEGSNPEPWAPSYAPGMLAAITGFRMQVHNVEAKRKLSQNRSEADQRGVIEELERPFGRQPDSAETGVRELMQAELDQRMA